MSRHFLKRVVVAAAALLVGSSSLAGVVASNATTATPPTAIGFDISFPQCSRSYPGSPGFGIVGVNNGRNFTTNPCLSSELHWAQGAANGAPAFYVNTGNPGPVANSSWPTHLSTPKPCSGENSTACSYDYGWNAARYSFTAAVAAEVTGGSSSPGSAASKAPWWLDVETANPWEARMSNYGPTVSSHLNDQSSLEGMIGYLKSVAVTSIGIYTASSMWASIMGPSVTAFSSEPLWIPGPGSLITAQGQCSVPSFIGGRVAMVQYPSLGFDGNVKCGLVTTPVTLSVPVSASATVSDHIVVTNNAGTVTFTQLTGAPSLVVSSSGVVTTSGQLVAGTYLATGTATDSKGNTDTFSFTLDVGVLSQIAPTTGNVKVSGSGKYFVQLAMANNGGAFTFTQATGSPALVVSPTGLMTTSGSLAAGVYSVTGTAVDASGDAGPFAFTLTAGKLVLRAPQSMTISSDNSAAFSQQLDVGANLGPVSYVQTSGQTQLLVSSTGLVSAVGALGKGVYSVSGTTSDTTGDVGTFTFTLTVTASATTTTTAIAPVTYSVPVSASATVNDQIVVTNIAGAVTFTQLTGAPSLVVSSSGVVTTSGQLVAGTYLASGTATGGNGNTDTFSFTLDVGVLSQTKPTAGNVKVSGSAKYSVQLALTNNSGAVTFTQTTGSPALVVSPTGLMTTSGPLAAGVYSVTGTTVDTSGDAGSFAFTLTAGKLVQRAPLSMIISTDNSAAFSRQLDVGANLGPVRYAQKNGQSQLLVSSTGLVTAVGALAKGVYTLTGTTSDTTGDVGTFTFTLTVTASATTTTTASTPVTTTTTVPLANPVAQRVIGHASAGRSATITFVGSGFYGRPTITSHRGTAVIVTRDTGRRLDAVVIVRPRSRNGTFTFTLRFARGEHCQVRYIQR